MSGQLRGPGVAECANFGGRGRRLAVAFYPARPDRYGVSASILKVGQDFNPEVGFLRRTNFTRSFASGRFSPRPRNMRAVRKFSFDGNIEYFENGAGQVESRQQTGKFGIEFDNYAFPLSLATAMKEFCHFLLNSYTFDVQPIN